MKPDIQQSGAPKHELRTDIQAMRGVAVLLVVLYHAGLPVFPAGHLGVDIFFVISGFLITGLIKKGIEAGRFSFVSFYYRRAKRLLPAAYVVLTLTILTAPYFVSEVVLEELRAQVVGAVTFTANFVLWQQSGYFDGAAETKPLLHFWSLSLEEQYYLLMPALLAFTPRRAWLGIVIGVLALSAVACAYLLTVDAAAAFYLLPTRAWQLALGSLGAMAAPSLLGARALSWLRVPALLVLFLIPAFPLSGTHPGVDSALVCAATLILIIGRDGHMLETSLPVRALGWVGNFSYSLYLVHWPLLVFLRAAWSGPLPAPVVYAAVAAAIVMSWLLYRLVEEPFRRGFATARAPFVGGLATVSAAIVAVAALTAPLGWSFLRLNKLFATSAVAAVRVDDPADFDFERLYRWNRGLGNECATRERVFRGITDDCRTTENPRVFLWGDSNAMMWGRALADELGDLGLAQATMTRCAPMYGVLIVPRRADAERRTEYVECLDFNAAVFDEIMRTPSIETVVLGSTYSMPAYNPTSGYVALSRDGDRIVEGEVSESLALDTYAMLAAELRGAGKRLVAIGPLPRVPEDPAACHERRIKGQVSLGENWDCSITVERWWDERGRINAFVERMPEEAGVAVVWPSDFLCVDGVCRTRIGAEILYRDPGHLSIDGAGYIAREWGLADRLLRAAQ